MIDAKELTPWTAPGLTVLRSDEIIRYITQTFELPDTKWVTTKSRRREYVQPRQILHLCLVKYLKLTTAKAAALTNNEHCIVIHSVKTVNQTLIHVKELKPKVEVIFSYCKAICELQEEVNNSGEAETGKTL